MCHIPLMRRSPLLLILLLAACFGGSGATEGEQLYRAMACSTCHGTRGGGGANAPPFGELAEHWTRETIAEYLTDPLTVVERTPRLKALKERYNQQMPPVMLPVEQRLLLADYVLELSASPD